MKHLEVLLLLCFTRGAHLPTEGMVPVGSWGQGRPLPVPTRLSSHVREVTLPPLPPFLMLPSHQNSDQTGLIKVARLLAGLVKRSEETGVQGSRARFHVQWSVSTLLSSSVRTWVGKRSLHTSTHTGAIGRHSLSPMTSPTPSLLGPPLPLASSLQSPKPCVLQSYLHPTTPIFLDLTGAYLRKPT